MSGDLAYTVGFEHSLASMDGGPVQPNTLRVTHVYRRENGDWKIVHRHGDSMPTNNQETHMSNQVSPFAVARGEGPTMGTLIDAPVTIKANTRNTGGTLTALEFVHAPYVGPLLHVHYREDELWYVLEGDYRFKAGDSTFELATGGVAFVPRGTPHAFQNLNDTPGRMLVVFAPSGMERFFEQHAALLPGPVVPQRLAEIAEANWMELLGPPLGESDPL